MSRYSNHENPSYHCLIGHFEHHDLRRWLLDGCEQEDAQTIRAAIKRTPIWKIEEALARVLAGEAKSHD